MDLLDQEQAHLAMKKHGKSFHFAKKLLGRDSSQKIERLYYFCRTVDDLVDEASSYEEASQTLTNVKRDINKKKSSIPWVNDYLDLCERNKIEPNLGITLIDGVLSDTGNVHIKTKSQLIQYAYSVAGVVGQMMCPLLEAKSGAEQFAIDLGIAMQLTNIARDVLTDAKLNRIYIPAEWLPDFSPERILAYKDEDKLAVQGAIKKILDTSEQYYNSAFKGLAYLPAMNAIAIKVAGKVYRAIGLKLSKRQYAYWLNRTYTTKFEKIKIALHAILTGVNRTEPEHNRILHEPLQLAVENANR